MFGHFLLEKLLKLLIIKNSLLHFSFFFYNWRISQNLWRRKMWCCVFQPSTWSRHEYKYCNGVSDSKECSLYGAFGSEVGDLCALPVSLISRALLGVGGGSVQLWHAHTQTAGRFGPVWEILGAAQRDRLLQGAGKKDRVLHGGLTNARMLKQTEPSLHCRGPLHIRSDSQL